MIEQHNHVCIKDVVTDPRSSLWSSTIPLSSPVKSFYSLSLMTINGDDPAKIVRAEEGKTKASQLHCYCLNKTVASDLTLNQMRIEEFTSNSGVCQRDWIGSEIKKSQLKKLKVTVH